MEAKHLQGEVVATPPEIGFLPFINQGKNNEIRLWFRKYSAKSRQKAPVRVVFVKMKYNESQGADNQYNTG